MLTSLTSHCRYTLKANGLGIDTVKKEGLGADSLKGALELNLEGLKVTGREV